VVFGWVSFSFQLSILRGGRLFWAHCHKETQMAKLSVHLSISWDPIPQLPTFIANLRQPKLGSELFGCISLNYYFYLSWSTLSNLFLLF